MNIKNRSFALVAILPLTGALAEPAKADDKNIVGLFHYYQTDLTFAGNKPNSYSWTPSYPSFDACLNGFIGLAKARSPGVDGGACQNTETGETRPISIRGGKVGLGPSITP